MVPLGEFAMLLIREALALRPKPADGEKPSLFVFVGRGETPGAIHPSAISHAMRDIRAAIDIPDITVHDLRRSGAARLAKARISPFILSKLLNHASERSVAAHRSQCPSMSSMTIWRRSARRSNVSSA